MATAFATEAQHGNCAAGPSKRSDLAREMPHLLELAREIGTLVRRGR